MNKLPGVAARMDPLAGADGVPVQGPVRAQGRCRCGRRGAGLVGDPPVDGDGALSRGQTDRAVADQGNAVVVVDPPVVN